MAVPIVDGLIKLGGTWLEGKTAKTKAKAEAEAAVWLSKRSLLLIGRLLWQEPRSNLGRMSGLRYCLVCL